MDKLSTLFAICDHGIEYHNVDGWVSYAFLEDESERKLKIFFQGSYQKEDWIANFWFFPVSKRPYKDMEIPYKVHSGFLEAWKKVEDLVIQKITETVSERVFDSVKNKLVNDFKWKDITVVGYSHGAALSGLCTECVWFYRPDLRKEGMRGYGFESPRFFHGWKVRKDLRERWENYTVIRVRGDIVTHLPPFLFRFCHVGRMIKLRGNKSLVEDKVPWFIKYHYPQVVLQALLDAENKEIK